MVKMHEKYCYTVSCEKTVFLKNNFIPIPLIVHILCAKNLAISYVSHLFCAHL